MYLELACRVGATVASVGGMYAMGGFLGAFFGPVGPAVGAGLGGSLGLVGGTYISGPVCDKATSDAVARAECNTLRDGESDFAFGFKVKDARAWGLLPKTIDQKMEACYDNGYLERPSSPVPVPVPPPEADAWYYDPLYDG